MGRYLKLKNNVLGKDRIILTILFTTPIQLLLVTKSYTSWKL